MANLGGRRGGMGQRTRSRDHLVQEFVPSSAWTEDSVGHYLLVDLPDFKKEEVKLQIDNEKQITVSGERLVDNKKYIYFQQTYRIPENADADNITGNFDGEILYVTVPKQVLERVKEPDDSTADDIVEENPSRDENLKENAETPGDGHQHTGNKVKTSNYLDGLHRVILDKWGQEESPYLDLAMAMIKNNKGILITAVVAFSIGVLVSRSRYESAGE